MRWVTPALLAGLLTAWPFLPRWTAARQDTPTPEQPDPTGPDFIQDVRPLLKTYCFECHNTTKRKAGLDLEQIDTVNAALDQVELWDQVGERLRAKEMPPAKSKQPTEDERRLLLAWVKYTAESQVNFDKLPKEQLEQALAGPPTNRRLNRVEYNNTLRDLFGVDLHPGELLPSEGGGGEGFDNAGATLFITPVLMEKYLEAAELVLGALFPAAGDKGRATTPDELARLETARRAVLIAV
ncbi:MAG TPA: DUF1587 domain-containing protein, partial [Gemmataceae bacterium]|nr:DUF1587 domain-containing protein [Gemmataceae bacterium]